MCQMRKRGVTLREIAREFGISYQRVGIITKGTITPRKSIRNAIRSDFMRGMSSKDIAKKYSSHKVTVNKIVCDLRRNSNLENDILLQRLLTKKNVTRGGCWELSKSERRPSIRLHGVVKFAYRFVWEMMRDKIPNGMLICHKCNNQKCINPDHLYVGTQADNVRDREEAKKLKIKGG